MKTVLAALVSLLMFSSVVIAGDLPIAQKKQAFMTGFLSEKISGEMLRTEFSKYETTPIQYLQYFRFLEKTHTDPILVTKFSRRVDALGQIVITPELGFRPISAESFPKAAYMKSILEFQKDFQDLRQSPKTATRPSKFDATHDIEIR